MKMSEPLTACKLNPSGMRLHAKRYGQVKIHSGSREADHLYVIDKKKWRLVNH